MKMLFALSVIFFVLFSACTKTVTYTSAPIATYSLGTGDSCTGAVVSGRFVKDTALTGSNTVAITVDVTTPGPYWITTNTVNGISFSAASTFTAAGPQTAILSGTGTPAFSGTVNFLLSALNGLGDSCTFSVTTVKGIPPQHYVTCLLNGVYRNFTDSAIASNSGTVGTSGAAGLDVRGLDTVANSTSQIEFGVSNTVSVGTGTYTDTNVPNAYFNYTDSLGQKWSVNGTIQPSLTIVVINANANNVQGTFSGTIKRQGAAADSIVISNGLFSVPVK